MPSYLIEVSDVASYLGFLSPEPYAVILRYIAKANEEPSRRSFFLTLEAFDATSYSGLLHGDVQRPKQRREQLLRYIAIAKEEPSRLSVVFPLYEPRLSLWASVCTDVDV